MMISEMIKKIKFWEKEELNYPIPFGLVDYTDVAKIKNIKDNQNKILIIHKLNKYGNLEKVKYKYSESLVYIMEKNGIPIYDKTKHKQRFEIVTKRDVGEIVYTK